MDRGDDTDISTPISAEGLNYGTGSRKFIVDEAEPDIGSIKKHWIPGVTWLGFMCQTFGCKLILIMFLGNHMLRGFTQSYSETAIPYVFAMFNVPSSQAQIYGAVRGVTYSCKFAVGVLFDMLPICGYHYMPWMIFSTTLGFTAYVLLCALPLDMLTPGLINGLLILCRVQEVVVDLAININWGKLVTVMPKEFANLPVFWNSGIVVLSMIAPILYGLMMDDSVDPRYALILCAWIVPMVLPAVIQNFHGENQVSHLEVAEVRSDLLRQRELLALGSLSIALALLLAFVESVFVSTNIHLCVTIVVCIIMVLALFTFTRPEIAKVMTFELVSTASFLSLSSATFYYYTDSPTQFPDGPHLDKAFYNTILGCANVFWTLIGVGIYLKYLMHLKIRSLAIVKPIADIVLRIPIIMQFAQLHHTVGISNEVMALLATVESVSSTWFAAMQVTLVYKCCPAGSHGSTYALMTLFANFASTLEGFLGAELQVLMGTTPRGAPSEGSAFELLWLTKLIASLLPLVILFIAPLLLPDLTLADELLQSHRHSPTYGSWLSRWRGLDE